MSVFQALSPSYLVEIIFLRLCKLRTQLRDTLFFISKIGTRFLQGTSFDIFIKCTLVIFCFYNGIMYLTNGCQIFHVIDVLLCSFLARFVFSYFAHGSSIGIYDMLYY